MTEHTRTILVLEQLGELTWQEDIDEVWNEAKAQFEAAAGDGRRVAVIDCFENALDLHTARKDAAHG